MFKSFVIGLCAAALVGAPAKASCWSPEQVSAAKVRDLDSMLMVASLRCRFEGTSLITRYNELVTRDRAALTQVNDTLRRHFAQSMTRSAALNAYDNYVTKMANRYGAGVAGLNCGDMESIVNAALGEAPTFQALSDLAGRADVQPDIDDRLCSVTVASRN